MSGLHDLNTEARKALNGKFVYVTKPGHKTEDVALLLIANFLREISDTSREINEHLNQISSSLQGIEMNTRPKP